MKTIYTLKTTNMKSILAILSITLVMTACTSKKPAEADLNAQLEAFKDSMRLAADTAGLAEFQQWKAQNELEQKDQMEEENNAVAPVASSAKQSTARKTSTASRSSSSGTRSSGSSGSGTTNTSTAKKGWSKAAKGAAIGGGTGAVVGAVINKKNRVAGGVIGGVVGGAVGYGLGRHKDKKDGRY
jgi:hypothetical protein